ncbi:MAG: hypothetical protein ACRDA8_16880 [Shewanella sp.]
MEKMREEFEAWCRDRGYTLRPSETNCGILIDGAYGHHKVQIAWESWQASRASLCVDLPQQWVSREYDDEIMNSGEVIESLENAGVSHK